MHETHYQEIIKLKKWFITYSGINKKYEAQKIWSRWLITYQSLFRQPDIILPTLKIETDLQVIIELLSKGITLKRATNHYKALVDISKSIGKKTPEKSFDDIKKSYNDDSVILNGTNTSFQISLKCYKGLTKKYQKGDGIEHMKDRFIFNLCRRYSLLDSNSLQWALPKRVFMFLNKNFNCNAELFASPFNVYFKHYYSLFEEDKYFGSKGNFFFQDENNIDEGCYQINPPFIEVLFNKISIKILKLLEIAEEENKNLSFIYIMPSWADFNGYDVIVDNKFCKRIITLQKGKHYYYQHDNDSYIQATFETKMIFLSVNNINLSDSLVDQIKWCWKKT